LGTARNATFDVLDDPLSLVVTPPIPRRLASNTWARAGPARSNPQMIRVSGLILFYIGKFRDSLEAVRKV
jgi:hypothetical protein